MKYLKQKLMAAAAMLAVSAVMLTSASYAWFTISVTPEVQNVKTTITANENFEIALGTDETKKPNDTTATDADTVDQNNPRAKDQTWGATITSLTDLEGMGPAVVNEVTVDGVTKNVIQTVAYADDGRPDDMIDATRILVDENSTKLTNGTADILDGEGNVIGQTILLWLRTNISGAVTVEVTDVVFDVGPANSDEKVDRSDLVKVGFEVCTYDDTNKTVVNGNKIAVAAEGNTDGTFAASLDTFAANTEIPVLVHIYLDGANISNADVAYNENEVVIGKIEFKNANVGGDESYYETTQNPKPADND